MKVIKADLGDNKEVQILALADWHNGDKRSDGKKIMQHLDYLRTTPNAYAILNGNTWEQTAVSMGYSYQHIRRIYKKALKSVEVILDEDRPD